MSQQELLPEAQEFMRNSIYPTKIIWETSQNIKEVNDCQMLYYGLHIGDSFKKEG
jgi:hypothetical protein